MGWEVIDIFTPRAQLYLFSSKGQLAPIAITRRRREPPNLVPKVTLGTMYCKILRLLAQASKSTGSILPTGSVGSAAIGITPCETHL